MNSGSCSQILSSGKWLIKSTRSLQNLTRPFWPTKFVALASLVPSLREQHSQKLTINFGDFKPQPILPSLVIHNAHVFAFICHSNTSNCPFFFCWMGVPAVILRIDLSEFMDPSKVPSDSWFWGTFLNITVKCVVVTLRESAIYRISFILVDLGPLCCRKKDSASIRHSY